MIYVYILRKPENSKRNKYDETTPMHINAKDNKKAAKKTTLYTEER